MQRHMFVILGLSVSYRTHQITISPDGDNYGKTRPIQDISQQLADVICECDACSVKITSSSTDT